MRHLVQLCGIRSLDYERIFRLAETLQIEVEDNRDQPRPWFSRCLAGQGLLANRFPFRGWATAAAVHCSPIEIVKWHSLFKMQVHSLHHRRPLSLPRSKFTRR
jgi:hypothetical protein